MKRLHRIFSFVFSRVRSIVFSSGNHEFSDLQGSFYWLLIGIWVFLPQGTGTKGNLQDFLSRVIHLRTFEVLCICQGFFEFTALMVNNYRVRRFGLLSASVLWMFLGISICFQNWHLVYVPLFFVFAVSSAIRFVRLHSVKNEENANTNSSL